MTLMQDPASRLGAITPSDSAKLTGVRAVYIGGAGNIAIRAKGNAAPVTLVGVTAGSILAIRAEYIYATNTTATSIVALY